MPKMLVVDDDRLILDCFRYAYPEPGYELLLADKAMDAISLFEANRPDVAILDMRLPDLSGLALFERLKQIDPKVPILLMTGHSTANNTIEALRMGAFEYILKPLDLDLLQTVVDRAFETSRLMRVPARIADAGDHPAPADLLVGRCTAMQDVYRQIGRVSAQDVTVLILGESGTGKEVVARAIYHYSHRADKPFLAINCAAIPETLLESELFGHERGAFTGAERKRIGKFEQCNGGTLFLDEIGDMTPLTQTKVLRVLQDQQFERVGGNETIQANVRLIAATNRDLEAMMEQDEFRSDLYYRLNVYTIRLPALRDRLGDLPVLVDHFLKRFGLELGKKFTQVAPETLAVLSNYPWPGNLRELQSVLKHAVVEATGPILLPEFLPEPVRRPGDSLDASKSHSAAHAEFVNQIRTRLREGTANLYDEVVHSVERTLFTEVLQHVDGNLSRAAAVLGVSRSTLRAKLAQLGLTMDRSVKFSE